VTGIADAIVTRYSCRTFDGKPLTAGERSRVEDLAAGPHDVPFGNQPRFALLDSADAAATGGTGAARLGTYGIIRGAPCFVAGAVLEGPGALEDFGFALERIILTLTTMGLATCWLAGTYRRGGFADRLALEDGEILPAVTPVGRPAARPSLADAVMRAGAGSSRRRAWEYLFTVSREEAGPWAPCLEAVRRSPSATNGQPWRIAKEPGRPIFHLGLAGPASERSVRRLDAGIAMCHFALAAAQLGLAGAWAAPDAARKVRHPLLPPGTVHVASWFPA
jgi:nitroreductase